MGVKLDFIRPGKPVENSYIESFNGRLRDECLNVEMFLDLADAQLKIEKWRRENSVHTVRWPSWERVYQGLEGVHFRGVSASRGGIENDTVIVRSGGRVPCCMALARISTAVPASGGK